MKTFENLFMREECLSLYETVNKIFLEDEFKDDLFRSNMLNSVLRIANTIAEGHENSLKNGLEEYLLRSKSYVGHVKTLAYLGKQLSYFNQEELDEIINKSSKIAGGLYKYIDSRKPKTE